jgi:hypothetical protein
VRRDDPADPAVELLATPWSQRDQIVAETQLREQAQGLAVARPERLSGKIDEKPLEYLAARPPADVRLALQDADAGASRGEPLRDASPTRGRPAKPVCPSRSPGGVGVANRSPGSGVLRMAGGGASLRFWGVRRADVQYAAPE